MVCSCYLTLALVTTLVLTDRLRSESAWPLSRIKAAFIRGARFWYLIWPLLSVSWITSRQKWSNLVVLGSYTGISTFDWYNAHSSWMKDTSSWGSNFFETCCIAATVFVCLRFKVLGHVKCLRSWFDRGSGICRYVMVFRKKVLIPSITPSCFSVDIRDKHLRVSVPMTRSLSRSWWSVTLQSTEPSACLFLSSTTCLFRKRFMSFVRTPHMS